MEGNLLRGRGGGGGVGVVRVLGLQERKLGVARLRASGGCHIIEPLEGPKLKPPGGVAGGADVKV